MKKHIIAAAVAAAVAVPAVAQVSVSGRLDQSFGIISNVGAVAGAGADSTQFVASSLLFTNFLRFSGSEDLGGGLKASFVLETNIGANSNDGTNTFSFGDRGAELTLSGAFGGISVGKAQTSDINTIASGPTNNTNLIISGGDAATNPRPSNRILYTTPNLQGFSARIGYSTNANDAVAGDFAGGLNAVPGAEAVTAATKGNGKYQSIGVSYSSGPVAFTMAHAKLNTVAASVTTNVVNEGARASYNFGLATVQIAYLTTTNSANTINLAATSLDLIVPLGTGLTLNVGAVSNEDEIVAQRQLSSDRYSVTLRKDLSKRTSLYGTYASVVGGTTSITTAVSNLGVPGAGRGQTAVFTGIVHTF